LPLDKIGSSLGLGYSGAKRKAGTNWEFSSNLSSVYLDVLNEITTSGMTFKDKNVLLTIVRNSSIGVEIVKVCFLVVFMLGVWGSDI